MIFFSWLAYAKRIVYERVSIYAGAVISKAWRRSSGLAQAKNDRQATSGVTILKKGMSEASILARAKMGGTRRMARTL